MSPTALPRVSLDILPLLDAVDEIKCMVHLTIWIFPLQEKLTAAFFQSKGFTCDNQHIIIINTLV